MVRWIAPPGSGDLIPRLQHRAAVALARTPDPIRGLCPVATTVAVRGRAENAIAVLDRPVSGCTGSLGAARRPAPTPDPTLPRAPTVFSPGGDAHLPAQAARAGF